jgi:hypothetical protein
MPKAIESKFVKSIKSFPKPKARTDGPLWKGPKDQGITFSLLSRYLVCKERFRIMTIEGLGVNEGFNHRFGYGNMWHKCEEAFASEVEHFGEFVGTTAIDDALRQHVKEEMAKYPLQQEEIDKWYNVCKVQFPAYVNHWQKHPDVTNRTPILQEKEFGIPYLLPSGRIVLLRGKWDSVDFITENGKTYIWLQENKTKGDVKVVQLERQLTFDLQTMMYLVALYEQNDTQTSENSLWKDVGSAAQVIRGVRYNVIRRPLSGGKHTIVQHKPSKSNPRGEGKEEYFNRLGSLIKENPQDFFWRWNSNVSPTEVDRFKKTCLDPILENLTDDYEWWAFCKNEKADVFDGENRREVFPHHSPRHFRYPFGVFNPLTEGGATDVDEYLATGSEIGLKRIDNLFPELSS